MPALRAPPIVFPLGSSGAHSWVPLLHGRAAARVEEIVEQIAWSLCRDADRTPGLATGGAGVALFLSQYARATGNLHAAAVATAALEAAVSQALKVPRLGLLDGLLGVAWVAHFLTASGARAPVPQLCTAIDALTVRVTSKQGAALHFDLGAGLAGVAVYAAERLPRRSATLALSRVVHALARRAERQPSGTCWVSRPEHLLVTRPGEDRARRLDLGLAHGGPGALVALSIAEATGIEAATAAPLLDDGVRWVLAQWRRFQPGGLPMYLDAHGQVGPVRLGWCYGDPGLAGALSTVARLRRRPDWQAAAVAIGRTLVLSHRAAESLEDACFCHGTAGLLHITHRLYRTSGEASLRKRAVSWLEATLAHHQPGRRVGGFKTVGATRGPRSGERWLRQRGLLTGVAGIGLALLATIDNAPPDWDRVLMLSPPDFSNGSGAPR